MKLKGLSGDKSLSCLEKVESENEDVNKERHSEIYSLILLMKER